MADNSTTIEHLKSLLAQFVHERQWEPFHTPKNLTMSLAVEAAELMEHFLWMDNARSLEVVQDSAKLEKVADEIADVTALLICLCNVLNLDLSEAVERKLVKNAAKYPADKYKGRYEI